MGKSAVDHFYPTLLGEKAQEGKAEPMKPLGPYLSKIGNYHAHYCPGCREMHVIGVDEPLKNGARWTFDGNLEKPTFSPSVRIRFPKEQLGNPETVECCHYFLKAGKLEFCGDSSHELSGKTVPLPPFPDGWLEEPPT